MGIGPKGIEVTYNSALLMSRGRKVTENRGVFHGQRTNAAYGLVNMAPRWYLTYDLAYGRKIYPYVIGIVDFWEDYLKWEEEAQRYVIIDACQDYGYSYLISQSAEYNEKIHIVVNSDICFRLPGRFTLCGNTTTT